MVKKLSMVKITTRFHVYYTMIRSVSAIAAGYLSIMALSALFRITATLFSGSEMSLIGVSELPSETWQFAVTGAFLLCGMTGGWLTSIIADGHGHLEILSLILLIISVGFIDYRALSNSEPLWYIIASPVLKTGGIFLGLRIKKFKKLTSTSNHATEV